MSNSHGGDTETHLYQSLSVHALYESRYVSMSQSLNKYLTMMSVYSIHSCLLAILDVSFRLFAQFFALNPPFHYVLRPRKHMFIWFLRQNPSKNYFAISLLRLIQFFPATQWVRCFYKVKHSIYTLYTRSPNWA